MVLFKDELIKNLKDKKKISDISINSYLKCLEKLNDNSDFKNLDFLKNRENIDKIINKYKKNTQRNLYISICSVLSLYPKYSKIYKEYSDILKNTNKILKEEEEENEKSESQKKNWVEWNEVEKIQKELYDNVKTFIKKKNLNNNEYLKLLKLMVLSLYVLQPPRRNADFNMIVSKNESDNKKDNFLNLNLDEFIFNNFKTKKKEGEITLPITDDLKEVIDMYLSHHPLIEPKELKNKKGKILVPFLVYQDGTKINPQNGITYILNDIFGKKVGSSLLRHSYLSHKYLNVKKEQEDDAKAMSHSLAMQKDYIKK
jgi:integrase